MRRKTTIRGAYRPSVVLEHDPRAARGEHRFDREYQACLEQLAGGRRRPVKHGGLLVHLTSDAVAAKLADDAKAPRHRRLFYGRPDVDRKSTRLNSSHLGISYAVFCL